MSEQCREREQVVEAPVAPVTRLRDYSQVRFPTAALLTSVHVILRFLPIYYRQYSMLEVIKRSRLMGSPARLPLVYPRCCPNLLALAHLPAKCTKHSPRRPPPLKYLIP